MPRKKPRPSKRFGIIERPIEDHPDDLGDASKAIALHKNIISLSKEEVKTMSEWVKLRINDARDSTVWVETKDRIRRLRAEYEKGVPRTSTEMKGAHDYRTSLAASQTDSMTARVLSIFSVDPLLKFEGVNELGLKNARNIELVVDHHHDKNVNLVQKGDEISSTLEVEGHAVLYTPWVLEIKKDKPTMVMKRAYTDGLGKTLMIDIADKTAIEEAKSMGAVAKAPETFEVVEEKRTQTVKNFPDLKIFSLLDYLCPPSAKPGLDHKPAWESVRIPFTLDELEEMNEAGKIYPGILKEIKLLLKKKSTEMDNAKTAGSGGADVVTGPFSDAPLDKEALDAVLPCWVVWGKQKIPGKKRLQDAVTLYHEDSGWVLQTRLNPNIDPSPPMFHLRGITLPWRFAGMGTMEMASPGERTVNDLANYILDEGKIFSALPYKYKDGRFPGGLPPFEFWKGLKVKNMKDLEILNWNDRRTMDINVASFVRAHTERRTGQGDLQLGRESEVTGKQPPTARGILSILREGQIRYTKANFGIINELVRMGEFELKLFQQYMGANTPVEILGEDGKDLFPDGVSRYQIMGSYYVNANMAAQQMARELDAELNMQLYQLLVQTQNPFIIQSMPAYYEMTNDLIQSFGKRKTWLRPLSYYQSGGAMGQGQPSGLTPEEQQFVQSLLEAGVSPEEAKAQLAQMRSGMGPVNEQEQADADQQLLLQGQAA